MYENEVQVLKAELREIDLEVCRRGGVRINVVRCCHRYLGDEKEALSRYSLERLADLGLVEVVVGCNERAKPNREGVIDDGVHRA